MCKLITMNIIKILFFVIFRDLKKKDICNNLKLISFDYKQPKKYIKFNKYNLKINKISRIIKIFI